MCFASVPDIFIGQPIPLYAAASVEEAMVIDINVTEGGNVTFQCAMITATPTLNVRFPGESFGTTLPSNLREDDELTFTLVNVSQSNDGTEFQCRGGGAETDIGVISVQSKCNTFLIRIHFYSVCVPIIFYSQLPANFTITAHKSCNR